MAHEIEQLKRRQFSVDGLYLPFKASISVKLVPKRRLSRVLFPGR
jgi:hypothetical protein